MTPEVFEFVLKQAVKHNIRGKVLDVGAYDVNGTIRPIFSDRKCEYIGLDMRAGPNVDVVEKADAIPFADETFDCVTCTEMLEHDDAPFDSVGEMYRVLRKGGIIIITVPTIGFPRHDYPSDYWRFTGDGVKILLKKFRIDTLEEIPTHVLASAIKE